MKTFRCDQCQQKLFFENTHCLNCQATLGYLPGREDLSSLTPADEAGVFEAGDGNRYRMCRNYTDYNVCNWMVPVDDSEPLCPACRLNRTIPDLTVEGNQARWARVEAAKRRLLYTLTALKLPLVPKDDDAQGGLAFDFLADTPEGKVMTGHADGLITLNVAEADDLFRERTRQELNEPYRTLLGHFRHEVGHYYWDRLVAGTAWLEPFRALFGDERLDYQQALKENYENGPPVDWQDHHVSTYASCHPWEDWAETWAHYLHMVDTLETAWDFDMRLQDADGDGIVAPAPALPDQQGRDFEQMREDWLALTFALNGLNRSMGLQDLYPFVLSGEVVDKLHFVHRIIEDSARG